MKQITKDDIYELYKKFQNYAEHAEQHEFVFLTIVDSRLEKTLQRIQNDINYIDNNQKDLNAMFRVVLKTIGEDYNDYLDSDNDNENENYFSNTNWVEELQKDQRFKENGFSLTKTGDEEYTLTTSMWPDVSCKIVKLPNTLNDYYEITQIICDMVKVYVENDNETYQCLYSFVRQIPLFMRYIKEHQWVLKNPSGLMAIHRINHFISSLNKEYSDILNRSVRLATKDLEVLEIIKDHGLLDDILNDENCAEKYEFSEHELYELNQWQKRNREQKEHDCSK